MVNIPELLMRLTYKLSKYFVALMICFLFCFPFGWDMHISEVSLRIISHPIVKRLILPIVGLLTMRMWHCASSLRVQAVVKSCSGIALPVSGEILIISRCVIETWQKLFTIDEWTHFRNVKRFRNCILKYITAVKLERQYLAFFLKLCRTDLIYFVNP